MRNSKLSPPLVFILGMVTLGLADVFFVYRFSELMISDANGKTLYPMREAVLNVITFGIYGIYWTFKIGHILDKKEENIKVSAISILCTVLSAIPFARIVSMTLICNRMTEL